MFILKRKSRVQRVCLKITDCFGTTKWYELCSDVSVREKLKDKSAIQGAINVSWTMQKSSLLQVQADEVREESKTIYTDPVGRAHLHQLKEI